MINADCRRLILILILALFNLAFGPVLGGKIREGNRLFKEEKYDEALTKYTDAQLEEPESPELYFNIADILYRQRKFNEAEQLFTKAIPQADTELESKIYYNIGNCKYRQGQLRESIDYYKKALDLNPDDEDAKYNIEFVERKIKEMLSQAKERMEKQQQEQQKEEKEEAARAEEDEKEKEEAATGMEEEAEKEEAKTEESKEEMEAVPEELSGEEAEALLRMMAEEERSYGKPEDKTRLRRYPEVEKPW